MTLDKQLVSVDFTSGLDTKTEGKLVLPGKLTQLENGVFRNKSIGKRYGSAALSNSVIQGAPISSGGGIAVAGGELLLESGGVLHLRTASGWSKLGWMPGDTGGLGSGAKKPLFATLTREPVVRNTDTQQDCDQAELGGYRVYAWAETSNNTGVHVMVVDTTTGAVVVPDTIVNTLAPAGGGQPRVVSNGVDTVFVFYALANKIAYVSYVPGASQCSAESQPITDFNTGASGQFDVVLCPAGHGAAAAQLYVAYMQNVTGYLVIDRYDTGMAAQISSDAYNTSFTKGLALGASADGTVYSVHSDNAGGYVGAYQNGIRVGGFYLFTDGHAFDRVAVWARSDTDAGCVFESGGHLYWATFAATGGIGAQPTVGMYNVRLVSRLALLNNSWWAGVVNGSTVQPTGFLINVSTPVKSTAVARVLPGLCGTPSGNRLASQLSDGTSLGCLFPERGRLAYSSSGGGAIDKTALGFSRIVFTPCNLRDLPRSQIGPLLYIGGARPLVFDGQQAFDAGFQCIPEALAASNAGAGALTAGTYGFQAVYTFTDAKGHLHRSAPSPLVQYVSAGGDAATVTGQSLAESLLGAYSVWVELYRTVANGVALYRTSAPPGAAVNTKNTATWAASGGGADTALVAGEVLYTSGGAIDNIGPPAYSAACVHQNRLFLFGLEDPYEFRFSTEYIPGDGLRFNEVLSGRVPASTGKLICGASFDDKLVLFAERGIYVVLGQGPDALGLNSSYSEPQLIPAASGCSVPRSVVITPDGVMFRGAQGICLLGHDLSVSYIGADVEAYNGYTIRSALVVQDQNQVRFQCDTGSDTGSGIALVYDYFARQWSVFTGYGAIDAVLWNGRYTRLRSDGKLLQETVGAFVGDDGSPYARLVETAWLKPAGIQGFQRIWHAFLLGTYQSDPTSLVWKIGYDYAPTYNALDQETYALVSPTMTVGGPYQVRRGLRVQKCEAIRFLISEAAIGGSGQGIDLQNLTLEVGVRRGGYKGLSAAKSVG
jgi:hypothetical protein